MSPAQNIFIDREIFSAVATIVGSIVLDQAPEDLIDRLLKHPDPSKETGLMVAALHWLGRNPRSVTDMCHSAFRSAVVVLKKYFETEDGK